MTEVITWRESLRAYQEAAYSGSIYSGKKMLDARKEVFASAPLTRRIMYKFWGLPYRGTWIDPEVFVFIVPFLFFCYLVFPG